MGIHLAPYIRLIGVSGLVRKGVRILLNFSKWKLGKVVLKIVLGKFFWVDFETPYSA